MSNKNRNYQNYYKQPETEATQEAPAEEERHVEAPTTEAVPEKVVVKGAARVNVRAGHNKDAQVITVLPEGAEITLLDHIPDGWDKVMLKDGTEGYMMSKFLKRI